MFDVIVLGLGAVGAAASWQLAKRGARVLGIDQFSPPHTRGSSHGGTRITRKAIGEGAAYVPLVLRSYELWREIEAATGSDLLTITGGLWISSEARQAETHVVDFFENTLKTARAFGVAHELLDAADIRRRFPQFNVRGNETGYYEPDAGFLRPEACVRAQLRLASASGARLQLDERVADFSQEGEVIKVRAHGNTYEARHLVLCAGAWLARLLPADLAQHFTVTRQAQYWFDTNASVERFTAPHFPVFIWELQERRHVIYGFPAVDGPTGGLKVATEQYGDIVRPELVEAPIAEVSEREKRAMHEFLIAPYLPGLGPRCVKASACLYTSTRDFHFVIDRHPDHDNVIIASPCSGHGFKHSAAVGEAVAEMVLDGRSRIDLGAFRLARLD